MQTYLGPPDALRVDHGAKFMAKYFRGAAAAEGISLLPAPIECPTNMTHVERYHGPLRTAFEKIRCSGEITDEEALEAAMKAVYDTVNPEGLVPTLLVYGAYPCFVANLPAAKQIQRMRAIEDARVAIQKVYAKSKIQLGLKTLKNPIPGEQADLRSMKPGDNFYVFQPQEKKWVPYRFVHLDGETVTVQDDRGRKIFRSTAVKPMRTVPKIPQGIEMIIGSSTAMYGHEEDGYKSTESENKFSESRREELRGLDAQEMFKIVKREDVQKNRRLLKHDG
jgi:hypothetical protein